jgi:adenylate cyclase, class 2
VKPGSNVELKLRCPDLARARDRALALGARVVGVEQQLDTYFCTRHGRLKLRERAPYPAELIAYLRLDAPGARRSDYQILIAPDPGELKRLLGVLLGVHAVVGKRREILLYENVRIHLDQVFQLGDFVEFEAVFDGTPGEERLQHHKLQLLLDKLELADAERVATSYEALSG